MSQRNLDLDDGRPPPPEFKPFHPAFVGTARVLKNLNTGDPHRDYFTVDLAAGTCGCSRGAAFRWYSDRNGMRPKWAVNAFCQHKIKALAAVMEAAGYPPDMEFPYIKALATRYNRYEVPSAFHKELRRGDLPKALFWGMMLTAFRGSRGVVKYLQNTIYEETRAHDLHAWLIDLGDDLDLATVCRAIHLYCAAPKKWELPHRLEIFQSEMHGYKKLARQFGYAVAEAKEIIPAENIDSFRNSMRRGFAEGDRDHIQYGLKGWFKSKPRDGQDFDGLKLEIFEMLIAVARGEHRSYWKIDQAKANYLIGLCHQRRSLGNFHYHEINAFADFLSGEPFDAGMLPPFRFEALRRNPRPPTLRSQGLLGICPAVPLYAHDNHTWKGKALMRRFPEQLKPGAVQTEIDFRYCGAYAGVAWRYLAWAQHQSLAVKWGDVKWPRWLWEITSRLFY